MTQAKNSWTHLVPWCRFFLSKPIKTTS